MKSQEIVVAPGGCLRSQPVAAFVCAACEFSSELRIVQGEKIINAKSMMGVLSLGAQRTKTLTLEAEGPDERQALERLVPMLKRLFLG